MKRWVITFARETDGQDLIEYALLAAAIAVALTAAMGLIKTALSSEFSTIANKVTVGS
jgi:Flp pilus assembly pilin Flp